MIVAFDNDVIHKLAALGLLEKAAQALGATERRVLATAKHRFKLKTREKAVEKFGATVVANIEAFLATATTIDEDYTGTYDEAANKDFGIDVGELQLFGFVAATQGAILATGDKRALRGLKQSTATGDLPTKLAGRCICFEQIIAKLLDEVGFSTLHAQASGAAQVDGMLRAVFTPGATEENVRAGIASYVGALRNETGSLLDSG